MNDLTRFAFACATICVVSSASYQNSAPAPRYAIRNEFIDVLVDPPLAHPPTVLADCVNTRGVPMVRLYVPTKAMNPGPGTTVEANLNGIFARYIGPNGGFGCTGTDTGSMVQIYLKSVPPKARFREDAVRLDKAHNRVLEEGERARVMLVYFSPGESGPMVDKRARVIFALTDSHATVTLPDGHSEVRESKAGQVYFSDAGRQSTKNTGTTPLANIVIELKRK